MTHISATTWISGISNYPCTLKPAALNSYFFLHDNSCNVVFFNALPCESRLPSIYGSSDLYFSY